MSRFDIKTTWGLGDLKLGHTVTMTEKKNEQTNKRDKRTGKGDSEKCKEMA